MFDLVSSNPMLQMMDRSMSLATQRMTLIAGNMANIDTPGYRAQDFSFESAFKQEMDALDRQLLPNSGSLPSYFPSSPGTASSEDSGTAPAFERNDLNDVNLDQQTMELAKTQNIYQMASNFALGAIRDGAK